MFLTGSVIVYNRTITFFLTFIALSAILLSATLVEAFFLCAKFYDAWILYSKKSRTQFKMEVEVVRVKITLACTDCKQRNYNLTKDKRVHTERMELKKYCPFCKAHTLHKETK